MLETDTKLFPSLSVEFTDEIRRYWITDPMNNWIPYTTELSVCSHNGCKLFPDGRIEDLQHVKSDAPKCIYLGLFLNIWGHCITDNLKKLWFLRTVECRKLQCEGYSICCALQGKDKQFISNFKELLSYLDINADDIRVVTDVETFSVLIEPDNALDDKHHLHQEYKNTIDIIRKNIPYDEKLPKKIYFSRSNLHNGRDFGEEYLEQVFSQLGYTIIHPEELTTEVQLKMLKSCDSFASTEGSISHNVMFCRPDVDAIIVRKTRSCNGYQYSSNVVCGGHFTYIDAHLSIWNIFGNDFGPFFLYVNDNLVSFAKSRGLAIKKQFPRMKFLHYILKVLFYAVRYRCRIIPIGDYHYYLTRLKRDFVS